MDEFNQYFNANDYKVLRANRRNQPATLKTSTCRLDYFSFSFETIKHEHRQAVDYMYNLGTFAESLKIFDHRPRY
ncbi:hypothetical protein O181_108722 [Austropuccinia psidii MF-1]|uniref:Uncharacterized protein n=1 Tax=Austropuccinia psidii MF-1 TaxID=1389203 RepID=A0A9Q3JUR8_9BASI|nr:hypothetical protein [Austropuccinia psidii MF-1]